MKALAKCKFYLLTLLAAVLFTVGTVGSDNQTDLSTPTVMILGTYHMANPGADAVNFEADDVLTAKRQRELQQLIEQLALFNPTKIAVEADTSLDAEVNAEYQDYLNGVYQQGRSEGDQVSFPLAKKMQHPKIYCVDWFQRADEEETVDIEVFAKAHNQSELLEKADAMIQAMVQEPLTTLAEIQKTGSVIDMLCFLNKAETIHVLHEINTLPQFTIAQIGTTDQYIGLDWLLGWYERNLKIFVNLTRITESGDRILLVIGAGHVFLVQQFLEDSGNYIVESPLKYLKTEEIH